jgi:hypothetical protein
MGAGEPDGSWMFSGCGSVLVRATLFEVGASKRDVTFKWGLVTYGWQMVSILSGSDDGRLSAGGVAGAGAGDGFGAAAGL